MVPGLARAIIVVSPNPPILALDGPMPRLPSRQPRPPRVLRASGLGVATGRGAGRPGTTPAVPTGRVCAATATGAVGACAGHAVCGAHCGAIPMPGYWPASAPASRMPPASTSPSCASASPCWLWAAGSASWSTPSAGWSSRCGVRRPTSSPGPSGIAGASAWSSPSSRCSSSPRSSHRGCTSATSGSFIWPVFLAGGAAVLIWRNVSEQERLWINDDIVPMLRPGGERHSRRTLVLRIGVGVLLGVGGLLVLTFGHPTAAAAPPDRRSGTGHRRHRGDLWAVVDQPGARPDVGTPGPGPGRGALADGGPCARLGAADARSHPAFGR